MGLYGQNVVPLYENNLNFLLENTISYCENFNILEESVDIITEGENPIKVVCKKIKEIVSKIFKKFMELIGKVKDFISSKFTKKMEKDIDETEKEINSSPVKDIKVDSMPSDEEIEKIVKTTSESKPKDTYKNDPELEKEVKANKDKLGTNLGGALKAKLERVINLKKYKYLLVDIDKDIHSSKFVFGGTFGSYFNKIIDEYLDPKSHFSDDFVDGKYEAEARKSLADFLTNYKTQVWDRRVLVVSTKFIDDMDNPNFEKIKENVDKYCADTTEKEFSKYTVSGLLKTLKESTADIDKQIKNLAEGESGMKKAVSNIDKVISKLETEQNLHAPKGHEGYKLTKKYYDLEKQYGPDHPKTKEAKEEVEKYDKTHYEYKSSNDHNTVRSPKELIEVITKNLSDMKLNVQLYGFLLYITTAKSKQTDSAIKAIRSLVK
jgi:septal ring factor EnvC (AmiA/AmiB activator)